MYAGATRCGTRGDSVILNEIDPQPRWQHAIDACLGRCATACCPPGSSGYWDNLALCLRHRGSRQFLLDRYQATGDTALLDWTAVRPPTSPPGLDHAQASLVQHRAHQDPAEPPRRNRVHARRGRNCQPAAGSRAPHLPASPVARPGPAWL